MSKWYNIMSKISCPIRTLGEKPHTKLWVTLGGGQWHEKGQKLVSHLQVLMLYAAVFFAQPGHAWNLLGLGPRDIAFNDHPIKYLFLWVNAQPQPMYPDACLYYSVCIRNTSMADWSRYECWAFVGYIGPSPDERWSCVQISGRIHSSGQHATPATTTVHPILTWYWCTVYDAGPTSPH